MRENAGRSAELEDSEKKEIGDVMRNEHEQADIVADEMDAVSASHAPGAISSPFSRQNLVTACVLAVVALVTTVFAASLFGVHITSPSYAPHYIYQAWSFLHGRLNIDLKPIGPIRGEDVSNDVVVIHGKFYTVVPPFPAVLMMPLVAIWGLRTSDILFNSVIAASNLSLMFLLLEQLRANGLSRFTRRSNLIVSLFFYFGTLELYLAMGGVVWYIAQVVGVWCTLIALLLAFRRRYVWAAALLGCAFFCRNTFAVGYLLLFYLAWQDGARGVVVQRFARSVWERRPDWSQVPWRRLAPIGGVVVGVALLEMLRRYAMFGSPLDSGYDILNAQHYPDITHGVFSLYYVPANFAANFLAFPHVIFHFPFDRRPSIDMMNGLTFNDGGIGLSVFATTPLFLYLFWRNRRRSLTRMVLWVTIGIIVATVLLYCATGWYSFGARYLFDAYPYAFVLLALSEIRIDWRFIALGLIGIAVNFAGAYQYWTIMHH